MRVIGAAGLVSALNALVPRMIASWDKGFWLAFSETFGVSAILWLSIAVIFILALFPAEVKAPNDRAGIADLGLAGSVMAFSLLPAPSLSAAAIVPLAAWAVFTAREDLTLRRIGLVLLALTLTLFWGPLILRTVPEVLEVDAHLAAWMLGSEAKGNVYSSADRSQFFIVLSGCSSVKNVSLATILAVSLSQYFRINLDWWIAGAILVASAGTIAVNVGRLAIMAARPDEFQYWHVGFGASIFGWLSLVCVCLVIGLAIDRRLSHAAH